MKGADWKQAQGPHLWPRRFGSRAAGRPQPAHLGRHLPVPCGHALPPAAPQPAPPVQGGNPQMACAAPPPGYAPKAPAAFRARARAAAVAGRRRAGKKLKKAVDKYIFRWRNARTKSKGAGSLAERRVSK